MTIQKQQSDAVRERLLATLPVTERRLQLADVSTAILEGGDGAPIVLLHGPGESAFWWMRVIPDLVTTNRVIVPDLPGHGASAVAGNALDVDGPRVARRTDRGDLPDTTDDRRASARRSHRGPLRPRPARSTPGAGALDALGLGRFRLAPGFAFGLLRFLVRPTDRAYHSFLDQCMVDRDGLIEQMGDDWDPFLTYNLDRSRTPSVKAAMRTLMTTVGVPTIPSEDLERIAVPTALIWGRHDRAIRLGSPKTRARGMDGRFT